MSVTRTYLTLFKKKKKNKIRFVSLLCDFENFPFKSEEKLSF